MSRFVQVGDIVRVSLDDVSDLYIIQDIQGTDISISPVDSPENISLLYQDDSGRYLVENGEEQDYQFKFIATESSVLTEVLYLDLEILALLDDRDLDKVCKLHPYLTQLCQRDELWQEKTANRYGQEILHDKPSTISFQDYYLSFRTLESFQRDGKFTTKAVQYAIDENAAYLFNYLYRNYPELVDSYYADQKINRKNIVRKYPEIFVSRFDKYAEHEQNEVRRTGKGHIYGERERLPRIYTEAEAKYWNDHPLLENQEIFPFPPLDPKFYITGWNPRYPYPGIAKVIDPYGNVHYIPYMFDRKEERDTELINYYLNVVARTSRDTQWVDDLVELNIPLAEIANTAAKWGNFPALERLANEGVLPDQAGVNKVALKGDIQTLEWLESRGLLPNLEDANRVAGLGNTKTLEWLESRGLLPDVEGANLAADKGHLQNLQWLSSRGINPARRIKSSANVRLIF